MFEPPHTFQSQGAAEPSEIQAAEVALRFRLPDDVRDFLSSFGAGEGWWGDGYLHLYGPTELTDFTETAATGGFFPDLVLIGSNGGGEVFAIDRITRRFVMTPAIGDEPSTRVDAGGTFAEFVAFVDRGARIP